MTQTEFYRNQGRQIYKKRWGNYKSDKYKSKGLLQSEISFIMAHGEFTKQDLIAIRDFIKEKGLS